MTSRLIHKKTYKKNYVVPILISILLIVLMSLTIKWLIHEAENEDQLIVPSIKMLYHTFEEINKTAGISGFDQEKTPIDFLNVEKFAGSEIGAMNLVHPEKWQGPYLKSNAKIQGIFFQIIKTVKGYFITPGDGVKLSNGKVIGKDIILNNHSDIELMMKDKNQLFSSIESEPMAKKLDFFNTIQDPFRETEIESFIKDDSGGY
jgi:hypothetical protein